MTIKRRLTISNVLMIVVPVLIAAVVAVGCVAMIWFVVARGTGLGFEDSVDFVKASSAIEEVAEDALKKRNPDSQRAALEDLTQFLDKSAMSLVVTADGETFYRYGNGGLSRKDYQLSKAAKSLGNNVTMTSEGRNICVKAVDYKDTNYIIYIYNTEKELSYASLERAIAAAGIILMIAILLSILFTNRFLTRFVFKPIEGSLDKLVEGVTEISKGNLDYRLEKFSDNEFAPVFKDFNDMAARLKASVEHTQREEESRKELMASISHDLRTPLTSIHAYVEGLLDGVARTPEAQRKYLETIRSRTEELEVMVTRVLEYSRLEIETTTANIAPLRLDECLRAEVESMSRDYGDRGLDITCILAPAVVSADPAEIHRLFVNIADNSLKYGNSEHMCLKIELVDKGDFCQLSFADNGPGVPEDSLAKIFDVFYRTDPSRNDRGQGNGLGLAIVYKIIANMGGIVRAENAPAGGLRIIAEIPKEDCVNV